MVVTFGLSQVSAEATPAASVTKVASLAAAADSSCALLSAGTVKCWGYNDYGQLGLGDTNRVSTPTVVPGLSGVTALAMSYYSTCALLSAGTVKCWGANYYGQLGLGDTNSVLTPTVVPGLSGVTALAMGYGSTCALLSAGTVKCWGYNGYGQLGLGDTNSVSTPTVVPGLSGVTALAKGDERTCALLSAGTVKCWGNNSGGQLAVDSPYSSDNGYNVVSPRYVGALNMSGPTNLIDSAVDKHSAVISFAAPADVPSDRPISGYEYSLDWGQTWFDAGISSTATSFTVNGLVCYTSYHVSIRAVNSAGPGAMSEGYAYFDTLTCPASAPTISSVVASNGKVTLSITAPVQPNGNIYGYDYSINNGASWSSYNLFWDGSTITGLKNGVTYQVRVRAVNSAGAGAASDSVTAYPTNQRPPTPRISSVVAGNAQVLVNVAALTGPLVQSITQYQYSVNKSALWQSVTLQDGGFTITGLTNGAVQAINIRTRNDNGVSASSNTMSATPMTIASAPTIQSVTGTNGGLTLRFLAPSNNGGSRAKNYQYSLDWGSTWIDCSPALTVGPTMTIKGLVLGTQYPVSIRMVNSVGPGEISNWVYGTATLITVPSSPKVSNLSVGSTEATFSIEASSNGSPVTQYSYSFDNKNWTSPSIYGNQISVPNLSPSKSYTIYLRASNAKGNSPTTKMTIKTLK